MRAAESERSFAMDAVYLQTNDAEKNEVIAFRRGADGRLSPLGTYATGAVARASRTSHRRTRSSSAAIVCS